MLTLKAGKNFILDEPIAGIILMIYPYSVLVLSKITPIYRVN